MNEISLGLTALAGDRRSHEFLEYRDVPQGVTLPGFRFSGEARGFAYDLAGRDAGQDDQRYRGRVARNRWTLSGRLDDVPHRLGDGRTPYGDAGAGVFTLPAGLQRAAQSAIEARVASGGPVDHAFLAPLAADVLRGAREIDLGYGRRTTAVEAVLHAASGLALRAAYGRQRREGTRPSGVGFGLQDAVEVAQPVDDATHEASVGAELEKGWGVLRAGVEYAAYRSAVSRLSVDNPLRADDATAPFAQLGPDSRTAAGARYAEVALSPDNDALTASAGAAIRLPLRTRVTADLTEARWRQSGETPFAITTNSAIAVPTGAPIGRLDGSIRNGSRTIALTSAPWSRLSLRGRFRRYDMDNRTPRFALPGVARLDAVFEAAPRLTVPYSHDKTRAEASIGYGVGSWRLEAGGRRDDVDRTFRETESTREKAWTGALSGGIPGDGHLRLFYERAHRDFEAYDSRLSPGASRVNVHPVRSLGAGRRYDQAVRDEDRAGARIEVAPAEAVVLAASYALLLDRYPLSAYGLVRTRTHAASADASCAAGRWSAHAFYSLEMGSGFQRVRHSPLPTISIDLRDIWDATLDDTVHSLGAGLAADLAPRTKLRLEAALQRADGLADFRSAPGGVPDLAEEITAFDDTRWLSLSAELDHEVGSSWSIGAGAWWDGQSVSDVADEGRSDYVPGALVLAPRRLDYGVLVVGVRITRRF